MMDIFVMVLEIVILLGLTKDASLFASRQKVAEGNPLWRGGCHVNSNLPKSLNTLIPNNRY